MLVQEEASLTASVKRPSLPREAGPAQRGPSLPPAQGGLPAELRPVGTGSDGCQAAPSSAVGATWAEEQES